MLYLTQYTYWLTTFSIIACIRGNQKWELMVILVIHVRPKRLCIQQIVEYCRRKGITMHSSRRSLVLIHKQLLSKCVFYSKFFSCCARYLVIPYQSSDTGRSVPGLRGTYSIMDWMDPLVDDWALLRANLFYQSLSSNSVHLLQYSCDLLYTL